MATSAASSDSLKQKKRKRSLAQLRPKLLHPKPASSSHTSRTPKRARRSQLLLDQDNKQTSPDISLSKPSSASSSALASALPSGLASSNQDLVTPPPADPACLPPQLLLAPKRQSSMRHRHPLTPAAPAAPAAPAVLPLPTLTPTSNNSATSVTSAASNGGGSLNRLMDRAKSLSAFSSWIDGKDELEKKDAMRGVMAYGETNCLRFGEHIMDGFYCSGRASFGVDDHVIISKLRSQLPANAKDMLSPNWEPPREILMFDSTIDTVLQSVIESAQQHVSTQTTLRGRLSALATYVSTLFPMSLSSASSASTTTTEPTIDYKAITRHIWNHMQTSLTPLSSSSSSSVGCKKPRVVLMIGEAVGSPAICRHRALLFKYLADHSCMHPSKWAFDKPTTAATTTTTAEVGLKVGLVRGYLGEDGHAWCTVVLDGMVHIVELYSSASKPFDFIPLPSLAGCRYTIDPSSPIPVCTIPFPTRLILANLCLLVCIYYRSIY
jgi:hypothetical protein